MPKRHMHRWLCAKQPSGGNLASICTNAASGPTCRMTSGKYSGPVKGKLPLAQNLAKNPGIMTMLQENTIPDYWCIVMAGAEIAAPCSFRTTWRRVILLHTSVQQITISPHC